MNQDPALFAEYREARLRDMRASLEDLNARIARLAISLDVPLGNDADVDKLIHRQPPPNVTVERRVNGERRVTARGDSTDRRTAARFEELRGLVILRYEVECHYVEEVGAEATRQILVDVEEHMRKEGFKPGSDGIDLGHLFSPRAAKPPG